MENCKAKDVLVYFHASLSVFLVRVLWSITLPLIVIIADSYGYFYQPSSFLFAISAFFFVYLYLRALSLYRTMVYFSPEGVIVTNALSGMVRIITWEEIDQATLEVQKRWLAWDVVCLRLTSKKEDEDLCLLLSDFDPPDAEAIREKVMEGILVEMITSEL